MSPRLDNVIPWSRACYGVDMVDAKPIVVQVIRTGRAVGCSRVDLNDPASRERVSVGRSFVAACLLERESFTRWLEAPFASRAKAERVLPSLLDIQLPFPLEECTYAFVEMGVTERRGTRALAAVARFPDIEKRQDLLKAAGIDAHALDQEGLALWTQSLREKPIEPAPGKGESPGRVVVYVSDDRVTIAVGRGPDFIAAHTARQPRADDIERVLWAKLQPAPHAVQWMWAGPGALDGRAVGALHRELSAQWPGALQIHDDPETFLARAVATRALLGGPLHCNLRTGPFLHPDLVRRAAKRAMVTGVLFLTAGVLLCGANLVWGVAAGRRMSQIHDVVSEASSRISGVAKAKTRGNEVLLAQRALDSQARTMAPFLRGMDPSFAGILLKELAMQAKAGHIRYDSIALKAGSLSLEGVARDWAACEKLSTRLTELGFRNKLSRGAGLVDENVPFSITPAGVR